ncbi:response regulator receiver domain [Singulisphaera rosea]
MPELSKGDAIRKTYLSPIRTVILVDDGFPPYDKIVGRVEQPIDEKPESPVTPTSDPPAPAIELPTALRRTGDEYERARSLWITCRERGYLCDIDDGSKLEASIPKHISKSDLVVLDFHLRGDDPTLALKLLQHLASSEHSSLVVVYTRDTKLDEVRRTVMVHLRGSRSPESFLGSEELAVWQDDLEDWAPNPSKSVVDAYLRGDSSWANDQELLKGLEGRSFEIPVRNRMVEAAIESFLLKAYKAEPTASSSSPPIRMSGEGASRLWVQTGNLFVAFLGKSDENALQGDAVFQALGEALEDWSPPYLPMVLSYARYLIARGGLQAEAATLSDPLLQAGWLYHAVSGADDERADRLRELFERLLSRHSEALLDNIAEFGQSCFPEVPATAPAKKLDWAKAVVPDCVASDEWHVLHRLNEFLATQPPSSYVGTGTIFVPGNQGTDPTEAWVCVTPACDMVPRMPHEDTWEHRLHPIRPMLALHGSVIESGHKPLKEAEYFKYIFVTTDNKRRAIQLVNPKHPTPKLEMFLLDGMGRITNGLFKATRLSRTERDKLHVDAFEFRVVGQLRGLYASRLLQQAGNHLSRIGPDFVRMPSQEK